MGHGWSKKPSEKRKRSLSTENQKKQLPEDDPLPPPAQLKPDPSPEPLPPEQPHVVTNKEIQQAINRGNVVYICCLFIHCETSSDAFLSVSLPLLSS